jgi:hydroxyethylthiazole kinase
MGSLATSSGVDAAEHLRRLRSAGPLVHNITNYVSMDISANALLAVGASPAMIHAVEEVEDFVAISHALVLNIGTVSPPWAEAMERAAAKAAELGIPTVLDPVGVGATPYRTALAARLARTGVSVIRGNASEILALAGAAGAPTRGVDATHEVGEAMKNALGLANELGCAVAVTGPVDQVTDGSAVVRVPGGSPLMAKVTAIGCAASAAVAAFLGSAAPETPPLASAAHALACFGLAGQHASAKAGGPGTFRALFIDALANLTPAEVEAEAVFEA